MDVLWGCRKLRTSGINFTIISLFIARRNGRAVLAHYLETHSDLKMSKNEDNLLFLCVLAPLRLCVKQFAPLR
jgi:hypothetical protein